MSSIEGLARGRRQRCNGKADSTPRASRAVPHPSTDRALCRLTSEVKGDPVHSTRCGRQRRQTGWGRPRAGLGLVPLTPRNDALSIGPRGLRASPPWRRFHLAPRPAWQRATLGSELVGRSAPLAWPTSVGCATSQTHRRQVEPDDLSSESHERGRPAAGRAGRSFSEADLKLKLGLRLRRGGVRVHSANVAAVELARERRVARPERTTSAKLTAP